MKEGRQQEGGEIQKEGDRTTARERQEEREIHGWRGMGGKRAKRWKEMGRVVRDYKKAKESEVT